MDTVFVRGLRADAIIGCYDHERTIRQPLIIDLELASDVASGAATDQLEDALDYAAISGLNIEMTFRFSIYQEIQAH